MEFYKNHNMAIKSDDSDIRETWLTTEAGGNGDYYVNIFRKEKDGNIRSDSVRISTSGGYTNKHKDVILAVANLYREMEKAGLNERDFK